MHSLLGFAFFVCVAWFWLVCKACALRLGRSLAKLASLKRPMLGLLGLLGLLDLRKLRLYRSLAELASLEPTEIDRAWH